MGKAVNIVCGAFCHFEWGRSQTSRFDLRIQMRPTRTDKLHGERYPSGKTCFFSPYDQALFSAFTSHSKILEQGARLGYLEFPEPHRQMTPPPTASQRQHPPSPTQVPAPDIEQRNNLGSAKATLTGHSLNRPPSPRSIRLGVSGRARQLRAHHHFSRLASCLTLCRHLTSVGFPACLQVSTVQSPSAVRRAAFLLAATRPVGTRFKAIKASPIVRTDRLKNMNPTHCHTAP